MYEVKLFLGFPINSSFFLEYQGVDPRLLSIFINNENTYLQEVIHQQERYLGKYTGHLNDLNELDLLSANIYSILKKVIPNYPYEKHSLILFPSIISL